MEPPKRIWVWWTLEHEEEKPDDLSDQFVGQAHATPNPECCGGGKLVGEYVLAQQLRPVPVPPRGTPKTAHVGDDMQETINKYAVGLGLATASHLDQETRARVLDVLQEAFEDLTDSNEIPIDNLRLAEAVQQMQAGIRTCPLLANNVRRCGKCDACEIERIGCACDGAVDDGCFLCAPERHERPECPT